MTRYAFLAVGLALAAATGCAQCDTCDDFPAPCTGPNCGQGGYQTTGFIPPAQDGLPQGAAMGSPEVDDAAPAMGAPGGGAVPATPSPTMPPTVDPSSASPPTPDQP